MIDFLFEYFSKVILVLGILIIVFLYFIYRKDFSKIYNSKVLFVSIFLFFTYWIPQGFDITDEGYILSKSWFLLHGLWTENLDMTWGSSLINGLWLSVVGSPSIIWVRIGFSILFALIAVVSFNIIKHYFTKKESFISILIFTILIPFGHTQSINYQNLPIFFVLLSFLFLLKHI